MLILLDPAHGHNTPGKRSPDGTLLEYAYTRDLANQMKATAISMLNNKLVVDIVNGDGAKLLQDALSKQQRSFLVLDHRSVDIVQDGISHLHFFERYYRPLVNVPACL